MTIDAHAAGPADPAPPPRPATDTSAARIVVGAALIGSGLVHLVFAGPHLAESTSHGAFFLVVAWAQLGFGVLFAAGRGGRVALSIAALASVGVIAVWVVSRTAGISGDVEAVGFPDTVSTVLEAVAALGCARIAMSPRGWFSITPATQGAVAGASVMAVAMLVTASVVPALAGEHQHDHEAGHEHVTAAGHAHAHDEDQGGTGAHGHGHGSAAVDVTSEHDHDGSTATASSANHEHGGSALTGGAPIHAHDEAATTTTTAHEHHDDGTTTTTVHDHGATTTTTVHDHGGGSGGTADDWEQTRLDALGGSASEATRQRVEGASAVFLADKIRTMSPAMKALPAAEREARIALFVKWTIAHALDSEHGGNHTHGPSTWTAMGAADTLALQGELRTAAKVIATYPTAADAVAAGYFMVTPWVPGIGAHYLNASLVDHFDPARPSMLLYNGNSPSSAIVGISYAIHANDVPSGFTGPNDVWHEHPQLCLVGGTFVAGGDNTPADLCSLIGGTKGNGFGSAHLWMMHLWQVPGWESAWGLFSGENPSLNLATTDVGT